MHTLIIRIFALSIILGGLGHLKRAPARPEFAEAVSARPVSARTALFDSVTLKGWNGDPAIWSVKDGAIHGLSEKGGQLLLSDGDYANFRLIFRVQITQREQSPWRVLLGRPRV